MNKKIVGGLLGILFVTSMVQTNAILKMQNVANAPRTQNVAMTPVADYQYDFNQRAAVGTLNTTPSDPTPQGYILYTNRQGRIRCAYIAVVNGHWDYYSGGSPFGTGGNVGELYSSAGCHGATVGGISTGSNGLDIELSPSKTSFDVSGGVIPVMQFKLFLLGYLESEQVTGKLDATTKSALMSFQKNRGLSQTGTYGPQTEVALDSVISSIQKFSVTSDKSFTFTK